MPDAITFEFDPEKFANAVAYLAGRIPNITKKQICKLLFFADKEHLLVYGRTITGDQYYALPRGHVPTRGLDVLNGREARVGKSAVEALRRYGSLNQWVFELRKPADVKVFSRSERKVLDDVVARYGHLPADELEKLSHQEPSWIKTRRNCPIPFELFFDGHPEAGEIKDAVLSDETLFSFSR